MTSSTTGIFLGVLALEVTTGLCSNIFIIVCLTISDYKEKYFAPYTRILVALCISNVGYTILIFINILMSYFCPSLFSIRYVLYIVNYMTLYSITSSSWLTCSLCFFYFVKIVRFQPGFLAWVKMRISTIVPWMILTVELLSLSESFLALLTYNQEITSNSTMNMSEMSSAKAKLSFATLSLLICSLPFSISILTLAASAWFLKQQSHHIKRNVKASQAGANDYHKALQTMSYLMLFYALLYLVILLFGLQVIDGESWVYWVCLMVLFSFSLVPSSLLITGNPKLKEALKQICTWK